MEYKGKDLEFISLIKRDGSGTISVGTFWDENSNHAKTDNIDYLDNEIFEVKTLSMSENTYIAHGFNSWVVKLKQC